MFRIDKSYILLICKFKMYHEDHEANFCRDLSRFRISKFSNAEHKKFLIWMVLFDPVEDPPLAGKKNIETNREGSFFQPGSGFLLHLCPDLCIYYTSENLLAKHHTGITYAIVLILRSKCNQDQIYLSLRGA